MNVVFNVIALVIAIAGLLISLIALSISKREYDDKVISRINQSLKNRMLFIMRRFPEMTMGQIADELDVSLEWMQDIFLEMQVDDGIIDTFDYTIRSDTIWFIKDETEKN